MSKKQAILIVPIFLLLVLFVNADININPNMWSLDFNINDPKPAKTFTLSNTNNQSVTLQIGKQGDKQEWIELASNSLTIPGSSTANLGIQLNIPSNASEGTYDLYFTYSSVSIPIIVKVHRTSSSTEVPSCRLVPLVTLYSTRIRSNTAAFEKKFTVSVNDGCKDAVDIRMPILLNVVETDSGSRPIMLGSQNLGFRYPGEEAEINIMFDITGMDPGTYSPSMVIPAYYKGQKIQTNVDFLIMVTSTMNPVTDEIKPPKYIVPDKVKKGEVFEIKAQDLNANLNVQLLWNDDLIGVSTQRNLEKSEWIWKGYVNKTKDLEVGIGATYLGGNIGGVNKYIIHVYEGMQVGEGNLTFDIFPREEEIKVGDWVSVLMRDSKNRNIIPDVVLYVNGEQIKDNKFIVAEGKQYVLSATHANYPTTDKTLKFAKRKMNVFVTPTTPLQGEWVNVIVQDPITAEPLNETTIVLDEVKTQKMFQVNIVGIHTIQVTKDGYETVTLTFNVSEPVEVYAPQELRKNKNNSISLSQPANWKVNYKQSNPQALWETIAFGTGKEISFIPKKSGEYQIMVNNEVRRAYTLKGLSFDFNWSYIIVGLIVVVVVFLLFKLLMGKGGGGSRKLRYGGVDAERIVRKLK